MANKMMLEVNEPLTFQVQLALSHLWSKIVLTELQHVLLHKVNLNQKA